MGATMARRRIIDTKKKPKEIVREVPKPESEKVIKQESKKTKVK